MDTPGSKSNFTRSLGDVLGCEGTSSTYPKPVPCLPRDQFYLTDWEDITDTSFYPPPTQPGRCCIWFKNRTPRLDFYGLVKNTTFARPHLVTAPAWPCPAARQSISSGQVLRVSSQKRGTGQIYAFGLG